ncbi:MAG: hypothetical protein ACHQT9_00045 [Candidatus Saccharimonadales bacterium]
MIAEVQNLQFELSTGNLLASQACLDQVELGEAPANLVQFLAMGKLVLYSAGVESAQAAEDEEVIPLKDVLGGEEYDRLDTSDYDLLDTDAWGMDDYVTYGRWLDGLTKDPDQAKTGLSKEVIKRAYYMGIGPSNYRIEHRDRFGSLTHFYRAMEVVPKRGLYRYDDWTNKDLANYAEEVFLELQSQAGGHGGHNIGLTDEIERRAKLGQGPALWIFKRNGGGGVRKFMAINGYPDSRNMTTEDYIQLGVRIMRANDGELPTTSAIELLSRSWRTPTPRAFWSKLPWDEYLDRVKVAYDEQETIRKQSLAQKLLMIKEELSEGALPRGLINGAPAMEIIARRAKWHVLDKLFPILDPELKKSIAQRENPENFVAAIRCRVHIDTADIEQIAKEMGVHEDVWPDAYMSYLRVPRELLIRGHSVHKANM